MYDTIIIGGGPAGVAAGVYAARKQLKTVLIAEEIGGQSTVSEGIENWVGQKKISGADLAKSFHEHLDAVKGDWVELALGDRVTGLTKADDVFTVTTAQGKAYEAKSVLVASGAGRRKLDVPGADVFENKGVTYCASCDGPVFSGMDVAVIGGGNAGFETAAQLLAYTTSVTLLSRSEFRADPTTIEKVCAHQNMRALTHVTPTKVIGEQFVTGLSYKDENTGEEHEIPVSGIFVEIGVTPNTGFLGELVELDNTKRIVIKDHRRQTTSIEGLWAAGDVTDQLYHQNNIAAGDATKAIEDLYLWVKKH